jgi:SAM-dependent methyltransferase
VSGGTARDADGDYDEAAAGRQVRRFFDELWANTDPWELESSELDQRRYDRQHEILSDRRYGRALEIGCGAGAFTGRLAALCDTVVAIDVSERAIEQARAAYAAPGVEYHVVNAMDLDLEAETGWDLVVMTETVYYLGWQYPMFYVGWLAYSLRRAMAPGGRLLLANSTYVDDAGGYQDEGIMSPWLIRSYHDLFGNVGFAGEREETMRGAKETVEFEILISLFTKAA